MGNLTIVVFMLVTMLMVVDITVWYTGTSGSEAPYMSFIEEPLCKCAPAPTISLHLQIVAVVCCSFK